MAITVQVSSSSSQNEIFNTLTNAIETNNPFQQVHKSQLLEIAQKVAAEAQKEIQDHLRLPDLHPEKINNKTQITLSLTGDVNEGDNGKSWTWPHTPDISVSKYSNHSHLHFSNGSSPEEEASRGNYHASSFFLCS